MRYTQLGYIFRKEDILRMSLGGENAENFGIYDILDYKGSYNCRHLWQRLYFRRKKHIPKGSYDYAPMDDDGMKNEIIIKRERNADKTTSRNPKVRR